MEEDDLLLEIATDKVDSEIPSPVEGIMSKILFKQDDDQSDFFIINKGKVQLKLENDTIVLALGKGDFFGEESLNEGQKAAYTVEVVEASDIIHGPSIMGGAQGIRHHQDSLSRIDRDDEKKYGHFH